MSLMSSGSAGSICTNSDSKAKYLPFGEIVTRPLPSLSRLKRATVLSVLSEAYFHDQTELADKQVVSRFIAFHVARVRPQGNCDLLGSALDPNLGRSTCRAF